MTARDDYDRAASLASQAREIIAGWRALMVAADNDALVPAYRALEAAQNLLDDESARLHVAVRVEPTDADRERVVCEVRNRLAKAAERKPSAGWAMRSRSWWLKAAGYLAQVKTDGKKPGRWSVWLVCPNAGGGWTEVRGDDAPSVEAAQLAAEDALLAIAAEIVGAVGR